MSSINIKDPNLFLNSSADVRHVLPDYPRQVRVELSSLCNASCSFCHAHGNFSPMARPKARMTKQLFNLILDDISSWPKPLKEIVPTGWGEVFLNREWPWMLQEISLRLPKTGIQIVTTGTLLTDEAIERLALVPTLSGCNVSINAFFVDTWTRIHKLPPKAMLIAINAVHRLRDRRPDVNVNVSMVHSPELQTEMEKDLFKEYWSQFGSTTVSIASYAGNPKYVPNPPVTLPCRSVFDGLMILDSGAVGTGCCFWNGDAEELAIGHFPEDKLLDIWRGDRLRKLTETHNSGRRPELPLCLNCTFA
jgi:hypothetical protein